MTTDRRDFIKQGLFTSAFLASPPLARALADQADAPLQLLASTPSLETALDAEVAKEYGKTHPPGEEPAGKLQASLGRLREQVPQAVPLAERMAASTKVYVLEDSRIITAALGFESPDKQNAIMGLIVSTGAIDRILKAKNSDALADALLGHEMAHHLLEMNPKLKKEPVLQPRSRDFRDEFARMPFSLCPQETADEKELFKKNNVEYTPENKKRYHQKLLADKKECYVNDLRADKLGFWLSHDIKAARELYGILKSTSPLYDAFKGFDFDQQDKLIRVIGGNPNPHATFEVRVKELECTAEDMSKAERAGERPRRTLASLTPGRNF